jgi:hypothetical protein
VAKICQFGNTNEPKLKQKLGQKLDQKSSTGSGFLLVRWVKREEHLMCTPYTVQGVVKVKFQASRSQREEGEVAGKSLSAVVCVRSSYNHFNSWKAHEKDIVPCCCSFKGGPGPSAKHYQRPAANLCRRW